MAKRRAAIVCVAAAWFGGCAGPAPAPRPVQYSHLTYERTYNVVVAALADQKLTLTQDRRGGVVVGSDRGVSVTATLTPQIDGTTRVQFSQAPEGSDPALMKRVTEAYSARMAQLGVLGVFKDSDSGGSGPVPCPSGPAFCP